MKCEGDCILDCYHNSVLLSGTCCSIYIGEIFVGAVRFYSVFKMSLFYAYDFTVRFLCCAPEGGSFCRMIQPFGVKRQEFRHLVVWLKATVISKLFTYSCMEVCVHSLDSDCRCRRIRIL